MKNDKLGMDMKNETSQEMERKQNEANEEEEMIEGFDCGCSPENRRVKMLRYAKANLPHFNEPFTNPTPNQNNNTNHTTDRFDVAGCRLNTNNDIHPFNETYYGRPLASCEAYERANVKGTGTVFLSNQLDKKLNNY
jgi:hypothetical protein